MKKLVLTVLIAGCAGTLLAGPELSQADQKWLEAVKQKIAAGKTTISTPSAERARLAAELAKKHGKTAEIQKRDTVYLVMVD